SRGVAAVERPAWPGCEHTCAFQPEGATVPSRLPEDLTGLSTEDLDQHLSEITERGEEITAQEEMSDEDIDEAVTLADQADAIRAEPARRQAASADRAARLAGAMARIRGDGDDPAADGDPAEEDVDEPVVTPAEAVAATAAPRVPARAGSPQ